MLPFRALIAFSASASFVISMNAKPRVSFWNAKEDAERYHREQYPKINEMLAHLLATAPVIRTFDVHTSTTHRVAAGKAAYNS
ncbi:MAG: hypothetical protein WAQ52_01090 [Terriglobales bacterium]